jgi:hypothetical protein
MEAKVGNYVKTGMHNYIGRVYSKHTSFGVTSENLEWFNGLFPKPAEKTLNENWYSVLCQDGGSILTHESDIVEVKKTGEDLKNNWEDYYFD